MSGRHAHMVGGAACDLCQSLWRSEPGIELVAFCLCAMVLPVWGPRAGERCLELIEKQRLRLQTRQGPLCVVAPVDTPVLLARSADTPNALEGRVGPESVQDQVQRLQPHLHGRIHLTFRLVDANPFRDAILLAEVSIEVNLGF